MYVASKDLPLATTTTGALPRPSWYTTELHGRPFSVAMADRSYREQYLDTVAAYVVDQTGPASTSWSMATPASMTMWPGAAGSPMSPSA